MSSFAFVLKVGTNLCIPGGIKTGQLEDDVLQIPLVIVQESNTTCDFISTGSSAKSEITLTVPRKAVNEGDKVTVSEVDLEKKTARAIIWRKPI